TVQCVVAPDQARAYGCASKAKLSAVVAPDIGTVLEPIPHRSRKTRGDRGSAFVVCAIEEGRTTRRPSDECLHAFEQRFLRPVVVQMVRFEVRDENELRVKVEVTFVGFTGLDDGERPFAEPYVSAEGGYVGANDSERIPTLRGKQLGEHGG